MDSQNFYNQGFIQFFLHLNELAYLQIQKLFLIFMY